MVENVELPMYDFVKACGVPNPRLTSEQEIVVFPRAAWVEITLVEPEGKTTEELVQALADAYKKDSENGWPLFKEALRNLGELE